MMNRRTFIKLGAGSLALSACSGINAGGAKKTKEAGTMASNYPGVSLLGFGAMRWPGHKTADGSFEADQQAVNDMVDYALEHGVNYFDTAPTYLRSQSEKITAEALSRHPRESYLLATKCSNMGKNHDFETGRDMFLNSLETFKTDHIDYYLLHCLAGKEDFDERFGRNGLVDYFLEQRKQGRIRHLGFSFHGNARQFDEMLAIHDKYGFDFVQIQMNYNDYRHAAEDANAEYMYSELAKRDVPVVIMEPLLGGSLANVPAPVLDMLKQRDKALSPAAWSFRFCGSFPKVLTVLSGMTCMEHLKENVETFCNFKALDDEEKDFLLWVADKLSEFPLIPCTGCEYCMPCPYGIDIPGLFRVYNNSIKEGTYIVSSEQKDFEKSRRKYLLNYNKAVPTLRQADHCIACGRCVPKCPQGIAIPLQLSHIDRYIEDLKQGKL